MSFWNCNWQSVLATGNFFETNEKLILQHDNEKSHAARVDKTQLKSQDWEILFHPLHLPDIGPSDYGLFLPMQ